MNNKTAKKVELTSIIPESLCGSRLDVALAQLFPQYSRARLQNWIKAQHVTVNNKTASQRDKVQTGQSIHIFATLTSEENWQAQAIPLTILYEDTSLLVVNKPAGLVVHPGAGNKENTLLNALLHYAPELAQLPRAGIVHRLDKDTSGLLIIARNLTAHHALIKQMQQRQIKREYQAIVNGILISGGTIETLMGRHPTQRTRMAVREEGKPAITHYRVKERFRVHTLVHVTLDTGRTHQIRVHMAHIHHGIVGDATYGGRLQTPSGITSELKQALQQFKRQALHAWRLQIIHPETQKRMIWEAPLPADMQQLLALLRADML